MGLVRYTALSREDIIDIWVQVGIHSRDRADSWLDKIEARCRQLADFPQLGPKRPDIFSDARALLVERWLIIYRIIDGGVSIVRIVDSVRDLSKLTYPHE